MKNKLFVFFSICCILLGSVPVFSEEKDIVSDGNQETVFSEKKQTTFYPKVQVVTSVGNEVMLPDTIKTLDANGDLKVSEVNWDPFDSAIFSTVGSYDIEGKTVSDGTLVHATVTVFPADKKIKVAVVGDSNIAGYGVSNVSINANPAQLNYRLGGNYEVKNYGNSGKTALKNGSDPYIKTSQYRNSLTYNPDIVIIQLGSNDSRYYNYAKIDQFVNDYIDIVKSYKNLTSRPIIYTSLPPTVFSKKFDISQTEIVKMLPLFFEIAETEDIGMVDNHTATADISDLMPDGIHPNAKGTSRIANSMYRSLKGNKAPTIPSKELNEYYEVYAGVNATDNNEFQLKELGNGSWISYKNVDLTNSKGSIQLYASVRYANTKVTIRKNNKDGEILGEKVLNTSGNISKFLYHEVEFTPTENLEDIYICVSRQGSSINDEIMRLKSVDFYYDKSKPFDVSNVNQLTEALESNICNIRFVEDIKLTKNIKLQEDSSFDLNSKTLDSGGYRFYTDNSATKKIRVDLKNGQLKGTTNVLFANSGNKSDANKGMNVFIENIMCTL